MLPRARTRTPGSRRSERAARVLSNLGYCSRSQADAFLRRHTVLHNGSRVLVGKEQVRRCRTGGMCAPAACDVCPRARPSAAPRLTRLTIAERDPRSKMSATSRWTAIRLITQAACSSR